MKINSFGRVLPDLSALSRDFLKKWLLTLLYLACDIDGCLLPATGLETAKNKGKVSNYLQKNLFVVSMFRDIANMLAQSTPDLPGLRIGLCTGRSLAFAIKIAEAMFTPGVCGYIVAEGGAVKAFYNSASASWQEEVPEYLNSKAVKVFLDHKEALIEIGTKKLGGFLELGKSVIVSFNPPKGVEIETYFQDFEQELIALGISGLVNFEHSSSAVDIGPLGVNKVACLLEIVGSANTAVLVDAKNDEGVTKEFLVNLMPSNAQEDIQQIGMQAMLSLQSDFPALYGTVNLFMKIKELRG